MDRSRLVRGREVPTRLVLRYVPYVCTHIWNTFVLDLSVFLPSFIIISFLPTLSRYLPYLQVGVVIYQIPNRLSMGKMTILSC